jgi:hypothetical protein
MLNYKENNMSEKEKSEWLQLMSFIKYKLQWDVETYNSWKDDIEKMDLQALTRWAISMDIIDSYGG